MLRRLLILGHRWLGVTLSALFLVWFASGIGMMYFPMPEVSASDQLARAPSLALGDLALSPAEAARRLDADIRQIRLTTFDGRPAYRPRAFGRDGGGPAIYADTGETLGPVTREACNRIASSWVNEAAGLARVDVLTRPDQWTLQTPFRTVGPLFKYEWPSGEHVYVSSVTGDVVQYTTPATRLGAYFGPIPHWLYFTPLRRNGPLWSRVVIWTSGLGTLSALIGVVIGVWMYSPSRKYRHAGRPTSIPYRGQKRWHTMAGLIFGVATITYVFSGLLSMDPFPSWVDGPRAAARASGRDVERALAGEVHPSAYDARPLREVVRALGGLEVRELEFGSLAGNAFYLARLGDGQTRVIPVVGKPRLGVDAADVEVALSAAFGDALTSRVMDQYDRYYLDRHGDLPLPVLLASIRDGARHYIDLRTGRLVLTYGPDEWVNRWLYHGLHSLDFPWLYDHRPLWDLVVITLVLGGTVLSVTSVVLAWRVVGGTLGRARGNGAASAVSDDVA